MVYIKNNRFVIHCPVSNPVGVTDLLQGRDTDDPGDCWSPGVRTVDLSLSRGSLSPPSHGRVPAVAPGEGEN